MPGHGGRAHSWVQIPCGNECIAVQRNASWSEKSLIADRRSMTAGSVGRPNGRASMFLSKERSLKTTNLRNLRLLRRRRYRSPCPGVVVIVHDGFRRLIVLNLFAASKERASCCEHFLETDNRWLLSEARIHGDGGSPSSCAYEVAYAPATPISAARGCE